MKLPTTDYSGKFAIILATIVSTLLLAPKKVDAHGMVTSPRSRNWRAHKAGLEWTQMGLNRKMSASNLYGSGLCGVEGHSNNNYDNFLSSKGLDWLSEATYSKGEIIDITTHLTAYHGGHLEIGACADASPTQACFDSNKLDYVSGGNAVDSFYPKRAYLGLPAVTVTNRQYTHKFKLPEHLSGSKVLLQWRYFTANSCKYEGYNEYFALQGWPTSQLDDCDPLVLDDTGSTIPERFWNCIEVTIDGESTPPTTPKPTSPTNSVSPTPQPTVTASPVPQPPVEDSCPSEYTGLLGTNSCKKFYHCVDGKVTGGEIPCPIGTLFDHEKQYCEWESQVTCGDSPPTPHDGDQDLCCPAGFTGLRAMDSCTKFHHCHEGIVQGVGIDCPTGTLFDADNKICNWIDSVSSCEILPCNRRRLRH